MIRAVVDTNVLASGFVASNLTAAPAAVINAWRERQYTLIVAEPILTELQRTFQQSYFSRRLSAEQIAADLDLLRAEAIMTPITAHVAGVATHPEDDLVLAAAVSAQADYLVTGDIPFRTQVPSYQGVTLISPRDFLELLEQDQPEGFAG